MVGRTMQLNSYIIVLGVFMRGTEQMNGHGVKKGIFRLCTMFRLIFRLMPDGCEIPLRTSLLDQPYLFLLHILQLNCSLSQSGRHSCGGIAEHLQPSSVPLPRPFSPNFSIATLQASCRPILHPKKPKNSTQNKGL